MSAIQYGPSQSFSQSSTLSSGNLHLYWCVRSRLKKMLKRRALSCNRTRSAPCALRDRPLRGQPLLERAPGAGSRCMHTKHSWRLRSALEPLLLDGNLRPLCGPLPITKTPSRPKKRRRTRRIPRGGNLVRIVRTFEPFLRTHSPLTSALPFMGRKLRLRVARRQHTHRRRAFGLIGLRRLQSRHIVFHSPCK